MSPERRTDLALRKRIDEILDARLAQIQTGYERWTRRTLVILRVLFLVQVGLGALSIYLVGQNAQRSDETRELVHAQQTSRESSVRVTCREQNDRHDQTIATLDRLLEQADRDATAQRRRQLREGRASTVLLIDALAPKRDCEQRVRQLAGVETP